MKILILALAMQLSEMPLPNYYDLPNVDSRGFEYCEANITYLRKFVGNFNGGVMRWQQRYGGRLTWDEGSEILRRSTLLTDQYVGAMRQALTDGRAQECGPLAIMGRTVITELVYTPVFGEYHACLKTGRSDC